MKRKTRYTVELSDTVINMLNELAEKQFISKAEVFRRALSLYDYVVKEVVMKELKLTIVNKENKVVK